jgi:hypothetical protein
MTTLKHHMRRRTAEPLKFALPATLWFGAVLWLCVRSGRFPTGFNLIEFAGLGVLTVIADFLLISRLLHIRLHLIDAHLARVTIVRQPLPDDNAGAQNAGLSAAVEILPASGNTWTIAGQPARWRVVDGETA